ncbi:LOW QUALITY PROTEIN: hypothetical protein BC937DRAFT_87165 [Endogone sp. FLAS-F59071]|nr:LOW QUALITY PROTEIN: hypothetical protein BC937DRAFT_87165 [Endogone sp. FLAS-F59071]|eukprot:RUS19639.1 LOW QUALITY PROTEIN: hypothetical protein BC937DRAFT_87165 [Endogone sp. FLAS-F59071]
MLLYSLSTNSNSIRKHLRTRRLTSVRQLGSDRIVDFDFGGGESGQGYHIIAEFYASDFRILSLLRVVQPSENVRMAVGELYNTETVARDFQEITATRLQEVLKKAGPKDVLKKFLNSSFGRVPWRSISNMHIPVL